MAQIKQTKTSENTVQALCMILRQATASMETKKKKKKLTFLELTKAFVF